MPSRMNGFRIRLVALAVLVASLAVGLSLLNRSAVAGTTTTSPIGTALSSASPISETQATYNLLPVLNTQAAPPLVMLLLSRDEQLSFKAYTDYTDLNSNGTIETTYSDSITYNGYFDASLCYNYSTSNNYFKAGATVTTGTHQCGTTANPWSGNFLNWATMSRLDIVRWVLYGGLRSADTSATASSGTQQTVLKRSFIPSDAHSWAKVYPNTAGDLNKYTPYTTTGPVSFCNSSDAATASSYNPIMRVAYGNFLSWASTESRMCDWQEQALNSTAKVTDNPSSSATGSGSLQIYVDVCDNASARESFCTAYTYTNSSGSTSTNYKPTGLLQKYGESGQLRFGLITGTYDHPRSGGALRRNIGRLAGNGGAGSACTTGDEIDLRYGTLCNQGANVEGVINTLNRISITQYNSYPGGSAPSNSYGGSSPFYKDCPIYGIFNRNNKSANGYLNNPGTAISGSSTTAYNCSDWGNPLAEMYAEAVRYITNQGSNSATSGFEPGTSGIDYATLGLPSGLTWTAPYSSSNLCASCSIIILSTGQTTFDTDEIPGITGFPSEGVGGATTRLGQAEGISGNYLVGYYGITPKQSSSDSTALTQDYNSLCVSTTVSDLNLVRGICPEQPSTEGGYQIAGMAFDAWTNDLITSLQGTQRIQTFAVSLAESLPSLTIPAGSGTLTLAPLCQANNNGTAALTDSQWRSCSFSNVLLGQQSVATPTGNGNVFGLPSVSGSPIGPSNSSGSITAVWDDSAWGNDHELDVRSMISWCVGSNCNKSGFTYTDSKSNTQLLICKGTDKTNSPACFDSSGNQVVPTLGANDVLVRVEDIYAFAGNEMLTGFSVGGSTKVVGGPNATTTDGPQRLFLRQGNVNVNLLTTTSSYPSTWSNPQVLKITAGTSPVGVLQNPLFYAAKYGGFNYVKGTTNPLPTQLSQWSTGVSGTGLPDNYFPVHNPGLLQSQLKKVFDSLAASTGSGTAAAVVANQRQGDGATYQALYVPTRTDTNNNTVTWLGELQALFVDSKGNLREDTSSNSATLNETDYTLNPAVKLIFDTVSNTTKILRYNCNPNLSTCSANGPSDLLDNLNSLWNARDVLATQNKGSETTQRTYSTAATAGAGRYIFTYIDKNVNGTVDSSEQVPFVASSFTGTSSNTFYGILNVPDTTSATALVNYVRGLDQSGLRNRTFIYASAKNPSNLQYTYSLGDIVNSTPTVVGTPAEAFDLLYNDASYGAFRAIFQRRRQVIYTGANDGMLHAFNGGFYNSNLKKFETTGINSETAHPLGAELWAYVPFNLLPHLTWLASTTYDNTKHVFYFDGTPRAFDAHVFKDGTACTAYPSTTPTSQNCHPYGWGTILVVGMRFGGGDLSLPACSTGTSAALQTQFTGFTGISCSTTSSTGTTINTHSAYVVLDVTNPEAPPTVLAEVTGSTPLSGNVMGYTTSGPAPIAFSTLNNSKTAPPTTDSWYFMVGSGPTPETSTPVMVNATSSQDAKLYVYKLGAAATPTVTSSQVFDFGNASSSTNGGVGSSAQNAFTGDPSVVDWNLDFIADAIYVGIAGGTPASPTGQLIKVDTKQSATPSNWMISSLTNPGAPVLQPPTVTTDLKGDKWVYDGTGRLFVSPDLGSSTQQYLFGVIDQGGTTASTFSSLLDVTSGLVKVSDGSISGVTNGSTSVTTEAQLESAVLADHGWKTLLKTFASTDTIDGAQRILSATSVLGGTLFASPFIPNTSLCLGTGQASLYAVNYLTGIANPSNPALGIDSTNTTYYANSILLGVGLGAEPALHVDVTNSNSEGQVTVVTQTSTGSIITTNASVNSSINPSEVDWRQTHPNTGP